MTTNSAPGGVIAPRPDPASSSSRSVEQRLETIERELNIPRSNQKDKTYAPNDGFNSVPPRGTRGTGVDTTIPSKRPGNLDFEAPTPGRTEDSSEPFPENAPSKRDAFKPPTNDGTDTGITIPSKETVIPPENKKPAPGAPIDKGQSLRLDSRVTSRAVAPRERLATQAGIAKPVATAKRPTDSQLQVDAQPRTVNLARY